MRILITGAAGYLGSALIPKLLARSHDVRTVDIGYFGLGHLRNLKPAVTLIREDLRRILTDREFCDQLLEGCDCVIHLAAISNDPSAELHPELTEDVNFKVTVALAEAAKAKGIKFLFSSSCSVYGEADGELNEDGLLNPLTVYAVTKVKAEQALQSLASDRWRPVILRNGTLFGYSGKMRFDLVINIFSLRSTLYNEIEIFGAGQQYRPFLHVSDCARAFVFLAEKQCLSHLVYNVSHMNLRVVDIAEIFQRLNPHLKINHLALENPDLRDYSVSTSRIQSEGFATRVDPERGAEEMIEAIIVGLIPDPESLFYRNAKWLKELTMVGSNDHRRMVDLMESFSSVRRPT
jgi:nucleoside-diphosphate-sugar epimerase